jgi:NAD(P)-dependent dehydrogenase (short-subunit alcohol dehydrogenase family)
MDLSGRVAIVTGGGTGLGAEVCRQLAGAGARVCVNWSRSEAAARELAASLGDPTSAVAVQADVRDEAQVAAMVASTERAFGAPVDLLVNNAGVTTYVPADDLDAISTEDWERIFGINVIGAWHCTKAVAGGMRARGAGAVVNVASDAAILLEGSSVPYVVSKVALVALTRTLAGALAPAVRVNAVAPGWMDTPWLDRYVPADVAAALRRGDEPVVAVDRVAAEILRLLADDAANGTVVQLSE